MKKHRALYALLAVSAGLTGLAGLAGFTGQSAAAASASPSTTSATANPSGIGLTAGGPEVLADNALFQKALKSPDWVRTPDGLLYRTCAHHIAPGQVYDMARNRVTGPHGFTRQFAPCAYPRLIPAGHSPRVVSPAGTQASALPLNGWQQWSWWDMGRDWASGLAATYSAPATPPAGRGTDYLFSSFQSTSSIIQPVIGYGGGWGNYLWEQSFEVNGNNAYYGTVYPISAGDTVVGRMRATGCKSNGSRCHWTITTRDRKTGKTSTLTGTADGNPYHTAQGGALEAYGINRCDQLFGTGHASFRGITIATDGSGPVRPDLQPVGNHSDCGLRASTTPYRTDIYWNNS